MTKMKRTLAEYKGSIGEGLKTSKNKSNSSCNNVKRTKKIGCLRANFSIPPLIMLVLKVIIPAYTFL